MRRVGNSRIGRELYTFLYKVMPRIHRGLMRLSVSENHGLKSHLKKWLLPTGKLPRRLPLGLLAGLTMELDFAHQSQRWLGLQERELYAWVRRLSTGIRTAVDIGANDGMY